MNLPNTVEKEGTTATTDYSGFLGMPVDVQMGHNFKASDATDFQASVKYGGHLEVHNSVAHKLNDNLTAKMHQHFFSKNIGSEAAPVDVGFEFSYKL